MMTNHTYSTLDYSGLSSYEGYDNETYSSNGWDFFSSTEMPILNSTFNGT